MPECAGVLEALEAPIGIPRPYGPYGPMTLGMACPRETSEKTPKLSWTLGKSDGRTWSFYRLLTTNIDYLTLSVTKSVPTMPVREWTPPKHQGL